MTLAKRLNAQTIISELHANAKAVTSGRLEANLNNSANGSYRNIFSVVSLQLRAEKQAADIKYRNRKKKK